MANVIEELLIGIGFKTDSEALEDTNAMLDNLSSSALKLGGILSVGFGFKTITTDVANANDQLGKFATVTGISASKVRALGYALEGEGGAAEDASGQFDALRGVLQKLLLGDYGALVEQLSRAGISTEGLENVKTMDQLLGFILKKAPELNAMQRRVFQQQFSLSDPMMRVAMGGEAGLSQYASESEERQPVIEGLLEASANFNASIQGLEARFNGFSEAIAVKLLPKLTEVIGTLDRELGAKGGLVFDLFGEYEEEITNAFKGAAIIGAAKLGTKLFMALRGIPGIILSAVVGELADAFFWSKEDVKEKLGIDLPDWVFEPISELGSDSDKSDDSMVGSGKPDLSRRSSRFDLITSQGQPPTSPSEIKTQVKQEVEATNKNQPVTIQGDTISVTVIESATPDETGRAVTEAIKAQKETRARGKLGNTIS